MIYINEKPTFSETDNTEEEVENSQNVLRRDPSKIGTKLLYKFGLM